MEELEELLKKQGSALIMKDEDRGLTHICWASHQQIALFDKFPEVICVDGTNREKLLIQFPLCLLIAKLRTINRALNDIDDQIKKVNENLDVTKPSLFCCIKTSRKRSVGKQMKKLEEGNKNLVQSNERATSEELKSKSLPDLSITNDGYDYTDDYCPATESKISIPSIEVEISPALVRRAYNHQTDDSCQLDPILSSLSQVTLEAAAEVEAQNELLEQMKDKACDRTIEFSKLSKRLEVFIEHEDKMANRKKTKTHRRLFHKPKRTSRNGKKT